MPVPRILTLDEVEQLTPTEWRQHLQSLRYVDPSVVIQQERQLKDDKARRDAEIEAANRPPSQEEQLAWLLGIPFASAIGMETPNFLADIFTDRKPVTALGEIFSNYKPPPTTDPQAVAMGSLGSGTTQAGGYTPWGAGTGAGEAGLLPSAPQLVGPELGTMEALWGGSASGVPTTPGTGALGMAPGSAALPGLLAIPAAAEVATQSWEGINKILEGDKDLSTREQIALALPTFGLSFAYNPVKDFFGSGKGEEQVARDALRSQLQETGFIDPEYNIRFADDAAFDVGRDVGGEPYFDVGFGTEGFDRNRTPEEQTEYISGNFGDVVGALNPLAYALSGGDEKLSRDLAGYLTNAAVQSGGDRGARVSDLYGQAGTALGMGSGMDLRNNLGSNVWRMFNEGQITSAERNAQLAAIDKEFGVENPTGYVAPL